MSEEKNNKGRILTAAALILLLAVVFIWRKSWKTTHESNYYAYYSDIKGLQASSHVNLQGVHVGKIADIDINVQGKVKVTITLKKDTKLPEGTVALLTSNGLLGDKSIRLETGTGPGIIPDGGIIPTAFDTSVLPTSVQITPYIVTLKAMLGFADSSLMFTNQLIRTGLVRSFTHTVINIEKETEHYANIVKQKNEESDKMIKSINNINLSLKELADNNKEIGKTIRNTELKTNKAAQSSIDKDIQKVELSVSELNKKITKINNNDSGLAILAKDSKVYDNAISSTDKINNSLTELKNQPPGFSIIGGKKKKK